MVDARTQIQPVFPPLYLAACIFLVMGLAGLATLLNMDIGLIYTCLGFIYFATGEIVNHPKEIQLSIGKEYKAEAQIQYRRNACSLGNLFDIIALLFFFTGLSHLLFRN